MKNIARNEYLVDPENCCLLVIDFQEKLLKAFNNYSDFLPNVKKMIIGAKILNIPIIYTEQYPKGLGETIDYLKDELKDSFKFEKLSFSALQAEGLLDILEEKDIEQVVVTGIEAHICVLQTVFDLIANSYSTFVAVDAIASRKKLDYDISLLRMQNIGAELITAEMFLFESLKTKGNEKFS